MFTNLIKKYAVLILALATLGSFSLVAPALAEGNQQGGNGNQGQDFSRMKPAVVGKVTAISGNILTVVANKGQNTSTPTTFTVDVTNAKILRGETVIQLSSVAVGDNVVVQGTVTGTNVVATLIRDGKVGNGNRDDNNQAFLQIQGNGQPVIAGTISAISGSVLTVANPNVTYTVNAANATILQGKNTILLAGLKVGDSVVVQGAITGTTVTASTIIDQQPKATGTVDKPGKRLGFFGSIGQFFRRLFGF